MKGTGISQQPDCDADVTVLRLNTSFEKVYPARTYSPSYPDVLDRFSSYARDVACVSQASVFQKLKAPSTGAGDTLVKKIKSITFFHTCEAECYIIIFYFIYNFNKL